MNLFSRSSKKDFVNPLPAGKPAPKFTLPANTGAEISLADFRGRPVVLVFYPADHSAVCSNQLVLYNEARDLFAEYDAQILGISTDDLATHREFAASLNLDFPLLSDIDPDGEVAGRFGVYNAADNLCERALFVIDQAGIIRWSYLSPRGENPGAHGILNALDSVT